MNIRVIEYKLTKEDMGKKVSDYLRELMYPEQTLINLRKEEGLLKVNNQVIHMNYRFGEECKNLGVLKITIKEERVLAKNEKNKLEGHNRNETQKEEFEKDELKKIESNKEKFKKDELKKLESNKEKFKKEGLKKLESKIEESEKEGYRKEEGKKEKPEIVSFKVEYEDEDILVINKPAGMPIHQSANNYGNTLADEVKKYMLSKGENYIFRCINRLDRDTSGLTIIAKNYLAAGILSNDMMNREIKREYIAVVEGTDIEKEGTIDVPIGRVDGSVILRGIDYEKGEKAVTHYKVIDRNRKSNVSVVAFNLETGRTHQIRVHMQFLGHPLIGDFLYNPENKMMDRQALHAWKLQFVHPISRNIVELKTEIPEDMKGFINTP